MIPKEKARELLRKVDECVCGDISESSAKYMAIIMCEEVIAELDDLEHTESGMVNGCYGQDEWREVIKEIYETKADEIYQV